MSNYEIFLNTINTLKSSQGFYSRLAATVAEMDSDAKKQLKKYLNGLKQWRDQLDCIFFLEG